LGEPEELEEEQEEEGARAATEQALSAYHALFGGDDDAAPEPPGPTDWRKITAEDAPAAWADLREWVEELVCRYPHLDHHVIPPCWYRHNEHVEALVALRDFERLAFFPSSPASSPYNFQVALAQIEQRLRDWTAFAGCLGEHREPPPRRQISESEWTAFIQADVERRGCDRNSPS